MTDNTIGANIRARRQKLNLTQLQLAFKIGATPDMVNKWEAGKYSPSGKYLRQLWETLGGELGDYLP